LCVKKIVTVGIGLVGLDVLLGTVVACACHYVRVCAVVLIVSDAHCVMLNKKWHFFCVMQCKPTKQREFGVCNCSDSKRVECLNACGDICVFGSRIEQRRMLGNELQRNVAKYDQSGS